MGSPGSISQILGMRLCILCNTAVSRDAAAEDVSEIVVSLLELSKLCQI